MQCSHNMFPNMKVISLPFNTHEMFDFVEHASYLWGIWELHHFLEPGQAHTT